MGLQWFRKTNSGKIIPISAIEARKELGVKVASEAEYSVMWNEKRELQIENLMVIYWV